MAPPRDHFFLRGPVERLDGRLQLRRVATSDRPVHEGKFERAFAAQRARATLAA